MLTEPMEVWTAEKQDFTPEQGLELDAIADLVDSGYMRGSVIRDNEGDVAGTSTSGPTLASRIFADEQKEILEKNSLMGRIKSGAVLFIGWLAGILSAVIVWRLTK